MKARTISNQPLVSVIIPAYNHEQYVTQSIESVLNQTYNKVEVVVVDDGSEDRTWNSIVEISQRLSDGSKLKCFKKENGGIAKALNYGIRKSSGELIAILASDDFFVLDKLEQQLSIFLACDKTARLGLVHSNIFLVDERGKITSTRGQVRPAVGCCFREMLTREMGVWAPSVLFKREVWDSVGGYDETLASEDFDFFAAMTFRRYSMGFLEKETVYKRVLSTSLGSRIDAWYDAPFKTLQKYQPSLSAPEYHDIKAALFRYVGWLAACSGKHEIAKREFKKLARFKGSYAPYFEYCYLRIRHGLLANIPTGFREYLRQLRRLNYENKRRAAIETSSEPNRRT